MRRRLAAATQTFAGAALMITAVTILARLLGFGRWLVQASELGTGGVASAYATANVLPNVLFEVAAGGALAGAVVPLLAGPVLRRARVEIDTIASALLTWAVLVLVPLGLVLALCARPIVTLLLGESSGTQVDLAASFLVIFSIQVPLYGVGIVLAGALQANRRFFWPAAAPMFSSLVVIVAYLVFGRLAQGNQGDPDQLSAAALGWLAWGTTAGVAAMSLPLLVPALRTGLRLRPTLRFPSGVGPRAARLASAGIGALLAQQASVLAIMVAALRFGGDAAFNVYQYSQAVYVLPYAVLAVPLATSAFPRLAARADAGDAPGFARLSAVATRAVLAVSALGAAVLVAVSGAVESFFGFTAGGVEAMAVSIAWSAPGLVGFALVFHLSRSLYALDAGRAAVVGAGAGWAVVAVLALLLPAVLTDGTRDQTTTLAAVGAANSVGMGVAGVVLLVALRRRAGADAVRGVGRTAGVLAGGVALGAWLGHLTASALLSPSTSSLASVGVGALAGLVAALVVGVALALADRSLLAVLRRGSGAAGPAPAVPPAARVLQVLGSSAGGVARHVGQVSAALARTAASGAPAGPAVPPGPAVPAVPAVPPVPPTVEVRVAGPGSVRDLVVTSPEVAFTAVEIADRPRPGDLSAVRALRTLAARSDVVHAHGLRAGALAVLAARSLPRRTRPRVVVTLHNLPVGSRSVRAVSGVLERVVARGADVVLGVSGDLVALAQRRGAREASRALVPAPAATGPRTAPAAVRAALGLADDERLLVTVARLAPQKGLDTLARAASVLRAEHPGLRLVWVVAGGGPLEGALRADVAERDVPVRVLGARPDAVDLMAAADVVVSTAVWEGQPLGIQEALRAGAAVVATDAGGTREVTADAAVLVAVGDAPALAHGIAVLLEDAQALAARRAQALRRAGELPTLDDVVSSLSHIYRLTSDLDAQASD